MYHLYLFSSHLALMGGNDSSFRVNCPNRADGVMVKYTLYYEYEALPIFMVLCMEPLSSALSG